MIRHSDFSYRTHCKGQCFGGYKVTNNSNHIVFYKGAFTGEVRTKKDAEKFIDNLVKHQKLVYTQEYH